jgi:hypothetical protein
MLDTDASLALEPPVLLLKLAELAGPITTRHPAGLGVLSHLGIAREHFCVAEPHFF